MSDNPKIMVFQLKELIYTLIFIVLGILLIFLLVYMFLHNDDEEAADTSYTPGTYSSAMTIGSIPVEVSVKVDSDRIIDIELMPVEDTVETMYPLLQSSLNNIKDQIISSQSLENIYLTSDSIYTYNVLMDAISTALSKATSH
ncbi:MAG: hypothetical protein K1W00_10535 [Lachnospiraceae bacterium]